MSLIIAMATSEGIVAAADTRTTISSNGCTRYLDGTQKIHPVYGKSVILNCGDNKFHDGTLVGQFVEEYIKREIDPTRGIKIGEIAYGILNKTIIKDKNADVVYLIAGFEEGACYIYRVKTKSKECICEWSGNRKGASFDGLTDICHAILSSCDYDNMLLKHGVRLCECALYATHIAYLHRNNKKQGVSAQFDIYIIDKFGNRTDWVTDNHNICQTSMQKQIAGVSGQNTFKPGKEKLL